MLYTCTICEYCSGNKSNYEKHIATAKHIALSKNSKKVGIKYECKTCNYISSNKNNYRIHLTTAKHKSCESCKKVALTEFETQKKELNATVVMDLIKENQEFKNMLIEQQKHMLKIQDENTNLMNKMVEITQGQLVVPSNVTTNNTNNTNCNNTNQQFNLNLFLNETCKNAINFTEFIENIQVSSDDLENNAKMGFVVGMTKIIVDNLKQMALNDRPIHCTDVKRETIYVKEENQWDKEKSNKIIHRGIQDISCKNMRQLCQWREENPEYRDYESNLSDLSDAMQQNSLAGPKREEYYGKIVKNLAKETIVDKNTLV
jgi:hypothetical protein